MVKSKIPRAYLIFLDRLKDKSICGVLPLSRARWVMKIIFRIPNEKVGSILGEMHRMGLIRINGQRFGLGHYTKSNSELCLIGVRGKGLKILDNTISQIVMSKKDKHSRKPNEVANLIIRLVGDRKLKAELFARKERKGWYVYGNEVKNKEID